MDLSLGPSITWELARIGGERLPLAKDYSAVLTLEDLEPGLGFNSTGRYLNSKGYLNLGLETVNVDRVDLEISRIYANNLVTFLNQLDYYAQDYLYDNQIPNLGKVISSETIEINGSKNQVVTTPIHLGQFLEKGAEGLFRWQHIIMTVDG